MHSRALVAAAVLLAATLTGCTTDTSSDQDDRTGTGTASPPPSPTDAPTETTEPGSPSPTIVPATGPEILVQDLGTPVLRLRLPDEVEWTIRSGGDAASSDFLGTGYADVNGRSTGVVDGRDLDFYARTTANSISSGGPELERLADRTVGGVEGFVLEGADRSGFIYVYGGVYGEAQVDVIFELPRSNARTRAWIESILASAEWL